MTLRGSFQGPGGWDIDNDSGYYTDPERFRRDQASLGYGRNTAPPSPRRTSYAGLGPRNYRRSDERISEDIHEELTRHPNLDASDIEVHVDHGVVTLTGTVTDRNAKRMAEDVAYACGGVEDVDNEIRIAPYRGRGSR